MMALWSGVEIVIDGPDRMSLLSLGMRDQLGLMDLRLTVPKDQLGAAVANLRCSLSPILRSLSPILPLSPTPPDVRCETVRRAVWAPTY